MSPVQVIALDFKERKERPLSADEAPAACKSGLYCWIDIDAKDASPQEIEAIGALLKNLGVNELAISEVLGPDREGRYDVHEDCLHFAVSEGRFEEGRLETAHVDVVLGLSFMVMFRRRDAEFVKQMRRTYREDFVKFARSPGFLLYEIGDHLIEGYRRTVRKYSDDVEQVQLNLFGEVNDDIFKQVAALKSDILLFRKMLQASRELMHQLATRRSPFVSETTQPALQNMAGTLERLGADLSTERDVLTETLALYMGMVSHRTSSIVSRLTVISMIFLPLGFIVGLYGSNFSVIPGTADEYGFYWFCAAMAFLALLLIMMMKKQKWI